EPRRSEAKTGYLRGQLTLDDIDLPTGRRASPPRFGSRLRPQYSCPADKPAHRVLTVQSFSSADGVSASQRATSRPTRLALGSWPSPSCSRSSALLPSMARVPPSSVVGRRRSC